MVDVVDCEVVVDIDEVVVDVVNNEVAVIVNVVDVVAVDVVVVDDDVVVNVIVVDDVVSVAVGAKVKPRRRHIFNANRCSAPLRKTMSSETRIVNLRGE